MFYICYFVFHWTETESEISQNQKKDLQKVYRSADVNKNLKKTVSDDVSRAWSPCCVRVLWVFSVFRYFLFGLCYHFILIIF